MKNFSLEKMFEQWASMPHEDDPEMMDETCNEIPEKGDTVRTNKTSMDGKVESVNESGEVFFRIADGRLMKTHCDNVTVVEKLADEDHEVMEDQELLELSNELLSKYKTGAADASRAANALGDIKTSNKRFSGTVKATNKQFANDAKKATAAVSVSEEASPEEIVANLGIPLKGVPYIMALIQGKIKFNDLPQPVRMALYKKFEGMPTDQDQNVTPGLMQVLQKAVAENSLNELDMSGNGGKMPPGNKPPRHGNNGWEDEDDDKPHPDSYFDLTMMVANSIKEAMDDQRKGITRYSFERDPAYQQKVREAFNSLPMVKELASRFIHSDIAAFKYFLTLPPKIQESLTEMWAGHGKDWESDLARAKNMKEGSMGGINRCAPSNDVSYEHVLDRNPESEHSRVIGEIYNSVMEQWQAEQLNELSVEKLRAYKDAAKSSKAFQTRPMRKLAKTSQNVNTANDKIAAKTGDRKPQPHSGMEEALDPWQGYTKDDKKAGALAKAPKSNFNGTPEHPLSELIQDTIDTHGVKWAFEYYCIKHGLPPRQFRILSGI